jgi:hypothetical protein
MPYADGFHIAASVDATRIAQGAVVRDAQLQTAAVGAVRHDRERARRLPGATRGERGRRSGDGADGAPRHDGPDGGTGRRLDRLA